MKKTFLELEMVEKFNPYHDKRGRFTTAGGATSMTYAPGKSQAHDNAIAREKERMARIMPTEAQAKTLKTIENRTRNLKKEQYRVVDREGNVVLHKQGDRHSVSKTVGEAREHLPNNITIHNHPDGGTFSEPDLKDFGYGATEIRAATPEGTYIMRNVAKYGKPSHNQKTWLEMQGDLEVAVTSFKTNRQLKNEIRQSYHEQLKPIVEKWEKAKNAGAPMEELKQFADEYMAKTESFRPLIEADARKAYVDQYHKWYRTHAGEYGFEYEFVAVKTKAQKMVEEVITKAVDTGEIVHDQCIADDVKEIANDIIESLKRSAQHMLMVEKAGATSFFDAIAKFNPYHDKRGRFTTANGASSFTWRTKDSSKQHLADKAIQRAKDAEKAKGTTYKLYHGSPNANITSLDIKHAGSNTSTGEKLLFFTDNKDFADEFAYERLPGPSKFFDRKGKYGRVYEVEVTLKNPLDFRNLTDKDIQNILKLDVDGILTADDVKELAGKNHQLLKSNLDIRAERLKELGYDGMIARVRKDGPLEYAVVSNEQATIQKINPYHDPKNGRFTFAPGGSAASAATSNMKNSDGEQLSDGQAKYFADSKAVDENGNLVKLYHGTVHDFTEFDKSRLQPDSDLGAGIYLTNSAGDGNKHYGNEHGPDLSNKIHNMTNRLIDEGMDYEDARALAQETFITSEPHTMECYVNMKKPIVIGWRGEKSTEFDMGEDDDGELDIFVSKMSKTISNGKYDCYNPDQFSEDVKTALYNEVNDWGPVDAQTIIDTVSTVARDYKVTTYNKFDDSVYAGTEIARDVFEQMGYDGFIDKTVSSKFRGMDLEFETTHYVVFNSNQVKLTSNLNPSDSADITKHLYVRGW